MRPSRILPAVLALLLLLLAVAIPVIQGDTLYAALTRSNPGPVTAIGTSVLRSLAWLSAIAALGKISVGLFLNPARRGQDSQSQQAKSANLSQGATGFTVLWGVCCLLLVPFVAADNNGVSVKLVISGGVYDFVNGTQSAQVWIVAVICAVLAVPLLLKGKSWPSKFFSFMLIISAMLLVVFAGQVSVGADHDFSSDAASFAVVAVLVWLSALCGTYLHLANGHRLDLQAFRRFHAMAFVGSLLGFVGYLVIVLISLAGKAPFDSAYGRLAIGLLTAIALAVGLSAWAWQNFNRAIENSGQPPRGYRLQLMAGAIIAAIFLACLLALQATVPPRYLLPQSTQQNFLGFDIDGTRTAIQWLLFERPNVLFLVLAVLAVLSYLLGVRRLRRRGDSWPVGRTISWILGWLAVYYFTSSVWAERSPGSFGLHMISHMGLNMLAPVLMVLGGPMTLALRALKPAAAGALSGPREWINAMMHSKVTLFLTNPLLVFSIFVGSYYALYFSPLFELGMRYHWAHQAMNIHFIISGYLFYWIVIGIDRAPRQMPYIGKLGFTLAAMPFHAFFAVAVMSSTTVIGENFYRSLLPGWNTDLRADQYLGGGVAWAAGELPLVVVVIALLTQWSRSDRREERRNDRRKDQGLDDSLDNYNDMLAALAHRAGQTNVAKETQSENNHR